MLIRRDHRDPSLFELEVVERKGRGHPDTLADTLAEAMSVVYSRECLARFGAVLHHNVDKLQIGGGLVESGFGWERYQVPATVVINGRMSKRFADEQVPIQELADSVARDVLFGLLPHLDFERGVRLDHKTTDHSRHDTWFRPRGLADLPELTAPTASDSTVSVGYWPLTPTEKLALRLEEHVAAPDQGYEWCGGDVKVLCVREHRRVAVTMSVPFISTAITSESEYLERLSALKQDLDAVARDVVEGRLSVDLCLNNSLRNPYRKKQPYLLATGSCIECGEEGVVGRGNPPAGVISSMRPHSV
ncbi:MAG: methionine adenosyltransferase, partial [Solirubrobacterales bacterium]